MSSISNIFLYSKKFYVSLSTNLISLYVGIIFVGMVDLSYSYFAYAKDIFLLDSSFKFYYNIIVAIIMVIIVGLFDVICFSMPIFDIIKKITFLNRVKDIDYLEQDEQDIELVKTEDVLDEKIDNTAYLIKFMKVYIMAHVAIKIVELIFWGISLFSPLGQSIEFKQIFSLYLEFVVPLWFAGIITRGVKSLLRINDRFSIVIFIIIYTWLYTLSITIEYIYSNVLRHIFKL